MKIKQLAKQVTEKRIHEKDEINQIIKKSNLINTKSDKIIFLKEYAENYPYPGLYINDEILDCAIPKKEFSDFIIWLIKKDQYILNNEVLMGIYNYDKKVFDFLYSELSKSKDDLVLTALGFVIGGMGKDDPQQVFELILQNKIIETSLIGAIWVTSMANHKTPDKIITIILKYTDSKNDNLRYMAINLSINQFHKNKRVVKKLIHLAKTDDKTKSQIAQLSGGIHRENPETAFLLLKECAKVEDQKYLDVISMYVGFIGTDFPMECLGILKKWLRKFNLVMPGQNISWMAEQIGASEKSDFKKIEEFLLKWINIECRKNKWNNQQVHRILEFSLPHVIHDIYKSNQIALLSLLNQIDYKQSNKKDVIVRIIETFFSEFYNQIQKEVNENCRDLLEKIAIHYKFDLSIEENLPTPTMETLALVQNIRLNKKSIDPVQTKRNLKQFPNIIQFLTKRKIHNLIDSKKNHPFVVLLSKSNVTKRTITRITKKMEDINEGHKMRLIQLLIGRYYPQIILYDLDQTLNGIKPEGTSEIKSLLLNKGFYEALTQLNIYARFKRKKYNVQLEPKLIPKSRDSKKGDLLVKIKNIDYYFELYQPKSPQRHELEYIRTAHSIDTQKLKSKIIDKFDTQLAATKDLKSPVILVIDDQHLSTTDIEIRDLLEGTLQFTFQISEKKVETEPYITRANDAFNKKIEHGNLLSSAILLRRRVNDATLKVELEGNIYENPGAKFPIPKEILEEFRSVLFKDD